MWLVTIGTTKIKLEGKSIINQKQSFSWIFIGMYLIPFYQLGPPNVLHKTLPSNENKQNLILKEVKVELLWWKCLLESSPQFPCWTLMALRGTQRTPRNTI